MSRSIVKFQNPAAKYCLILVAVAAGCLALYQARLDLAAAAAYQGLDVRSPESRLIAEWLTDVAPHDPYSRLATANYYERTFEPGDQERALAEYEKAAALLPEHYGLWLKLGAARERAGDDAGAVRAFERALELAPNYASVAWAFGNSLIRQDQIDRGFELIARAASTDPHYSEPAAAGALRFFDGDGARARQVLGGTPSINAALANVLASQRKWDMAYESWSRIPQDEKQIYKDVGNRIITLADDALFTRVAAAINADLSGNSGQPFVVGSIVNGGFEDGLKLRNAGRFEWQIAEGSEPQIGLSESVKRSGRYGMSIVFNSFEAADFRAVSQRVPVEPGATYEFVGYYRADIKSKAAFRWEITDLKQNVLGATEPLAINGDWTTMRARFTVPPDNDGLLVRFVRSGCGATGACPVTGRIFFDDLTLERY